MPSNESESLLDNVKPVFYDGTSLPTDVSNNSNDGETNTSTKNGSRYLAVAVTGLVIAGVAIAKHLVFHSESVLGTKLRAKIHSVAEDLAETTQPFPKLNGSGNYSLVEAHKGESFFDYYTFFDGPDSLGSAGYNTYVSRDEAESLGIAKVVESDDGKDDYVELSSISGTTYDDWGNRLRDSVRLEGKLRFDDGLILFDVLEMPSGCGLWPAFWTTDGQNWPAHGEIDIVEPINTQTIAKTVLHTTEQCDMYAHAPRWMWTGHWDSSTGLPEFSTGIPDYETKLETDNCWIGAPHQWLNQGCAVVHPDDGTLGTPMNEKGGGIYAMEWDPAKGYIRTWIFPRAAGFPDNLRESLDDESGVRPDPASWPTPYAFFPIGPGTGCSRDHFQNHNVIINLAICGTVAGNRFAHDCPDLFAKYNVDNDSVRTCNAYVDSDEARTMLDETAKWKIKGVYVYQRDDDE